MSQPMPAIEAESAVLTDVEQQDVERRVDKAKALLILDHPFFGTTVAKRPINYTYNVPTAGMSATGQIYINPSFVNPLTVKHIMFLLAHESMHYMLSHALRIQHRDHSAWNIACDKVINDTLIDAGVGTFIDGGVTLDGARDNAAEELYDENDAGASVGGIGSDIGDPVDDDGNQLDESQRQQMQVQAQIDTIQAAKAAKAVGKLPSTIERIIDEMLEVKTPWHEILERFMSSKVRDGYSWSRPNRRFMGSGMYLPGTDYQPRMGEVVIGVDTSGSIRQRELDEFNAHINRILDTCKPERVHVVYCDASVNHVDEYEPDDFPVKLEPRGGGGTSFKPVFEWVDDYGEDVECIVYLTDGYGDQNYIDPPCVDTVWLTTNSTDFNWGTVVKFESEV
jgi:predicted metal-dependent peptidase